MHDEPSLDVTRGHHRLLQLHNLTLARGICKDLVIDLLVEGDGLDVVEETKQVGLDGVAVTGLTKNLEERRVGNEEKAGEEQSLLLEIACE